jgi:predicted nucleic acid-binding Zn ribbon protein
MPELESIRTGLRNVMKDLLRAQPLEEAALMAWPVVCGRDVSVRTKAVLFADGVVTVEVPDAAWRKQLTALASRYISAYEALLGHDVVKGVRFRLQPSAARSEEVKRPEF